MKKRIIIVLSLLSIIWGCSLIVPPTPQRDLPYFKVFNKSGDDLEWVRIYVIDQNNSPYNPKDAKLVQISEHRLKSKQETERYAVKLRDFSKDGNGDFYVFAKKLGSKDTLSRRFWSYRNFDFTDNSYRGYNTFEIGIFDRNLVTTEIQTRFARYKKQTMIERF